MFTSEGLRVFLTLIIVLAIGGIASGECTDADNNNSEGEAVPVDANEIVSGVVCPDDPFDFYTFTIQEGQDFSGQITFASPQEQTVFRLYREQTGEKIINDIFTNATTKQFVINVSPGELTPGTYFIRVFFWSVTAYDHDYTITASLSEEEPDEPGEPGIGLELSEGIQMQVFINPATLSKSPWPSKEGDGLNSNRSRFPGPTGEFVQTDSWTLTPSMINVDPENYYRNLRVGPGNRIFYTYGPEAKIGSLATRMETPPVNLGSAFQVTPELGIALNYSAKAGICMDYSGKLYIVDFQDDLICFDNTLSKELWRMDLPSSISQWRLLGAGEYAYTYYQKSDETHIVQVWDGTGELIRDIIVPYEPLSFAEDAQGRKLYFQDGLDLYKFTYEGEQEWEALVFERFGKFNFNPIVVHFGPIVGYGGDVWASSAHRQNEWVVFKSDGSRYKDAGITNYVNPSYLPGHTDWDDKRLVNALRTDGKLVTVIGRGIYSVVHCWNDWNQPVWRSEFDNSIIHDLVMDSENRIYICISEFDEAEHKFDCYLMVLNPENGNVIYKLPVTGFPKGIGIMPIVRAELAIGEGNSLILLQQAGYVAIFAQEVVLKTSKPPAVGFIGK